MGCSLPGRKKLLHSEQLFAHFMNSIGAEGEYDPSGFAVSTVPGEPGNFAVIEVLKWPHVPQTIGIEEGVILFLGLIGQVAETKGGFLRTE